jgi:outer membrane receptor for ferrienterochelin and colicins
MSRAANWLPVPVTSPKEPAMACPKKAVFSVLVLFSALCSAALAQEAPIPTVQVAGPGSLALRRNDTVARIVVARGEIVQYGDSNLAEVLKRQPGISVTGGQVRMRGLGAGYTQVLINGEPAPQGFSIDSISPEMIERIEILRSATADQSAQAVAGSINLVLRKVVSQSQREGKAGGAFERGRWSPTASLQFGDRAGAVSYSLGATVTRRSFEFLSETEEEVSAVGGAPLALRRFDEYNRGYDNRINLAPRLNWTLANGDSLNWQNLIERSQVDSVSGAPERTLLGAPTSYPDNSASWRSRFSSVRSDAAWTHNVGEAGKLTVKAGLNVSRRSSAYVFDGFGPDGVRGLVRAVDSSVDEDIVSFSGKFLTPLAAGHGRDRLGWRPRDAQRGALADRSSVGPAGTRRAGPGLHGQGAPHGAVRAGRVGHFAATPELSRPALGRPAKRHRRPEFRQGGQPLQRLQSVGAAAVEAARQRQGPGAAGAGAYLQGAGHARPGAAALHDEQQ